LKERFDGFVATTDTPGQMFVEELMDCYPDAKVICTVRDPYQWRISFEAMTGNMLTPFWRYLLAFVPTIRYFVPFVDSFTFGRWAELYYDPGQRRDTRRTWDRHIEYIDRVVPKEKLLFFDVKEGWGPLCQFLEVEEPVDVEFPILNHTKAVDEIFERAVWRGFCHGLICWLCLR
jgi:hypothetical protein